MSPRLVFMGTAPLAAVSLEALVRQPAFQIVAVATQPDRPKGRELKPQPSAVKETAQRLHLPVLQPERARAEEFTRELTQFQPDLIVVVAYGQILPASILELPRYGCLNVHTSLLPKYRGAAPIQWALLNGDAATGVTIMKMDATLDTGPILSQESLSILPEDNASSLHDRLAQLGADLLVRTLPDYLGGAIVPRPQPTAGACYARKITKEDGRIDWQASPETIATRLRGLTPWPGLYTYLPTLPKPTLLKIWAVQAAEQGQGEPGTVLRADKEGIVVACGPGALRILALQREGARRLAARDFLAGHPLRPGNHFLPNVEP